MWMNRKIKRGLLIAGIFVVAIAGAVGLGKMKPPPETKDVANVAPLVETIGLEETSASFHIASQGTVKPRTETILSAEVSGMIVSISPKFIAGGVFRRGEELLRIDPSNYTVAVDQAQAALTQRQIEFDGAAKLRSQGYRAESEYASAAAALAAAKADLAKAERNLERTFISLPYDGMVRAKEADLGQYVNPGTRLGVTFATDFAEVRLPLTDQDLAFVDLPDAADIRESGGSKGPQVELSAIRKGQKRTWLANIVRTEGVVDEKNRVSYAVARIEDPYHLKSPTASDSTLPMGTFVAARIDGTTVEHLIRVPRTALRGNNQLMFVDADNRLRMRTVDVLRADAEFAFLVSGATPGDRIIVTSIESPLNGMLVRTGGDAVDGTSDGKVGTKLAVENDGK
jgi:RND family efflux transporter MFP subunit